MKKPDITEGEWEVWETATGMPMVRLNNTYTDITQMCYSSQSDELLQASKDMQANAKAISAVPDMIDALMTLIERIDYYASLADDEVTNIEQWAYTDQSDDIKKAKQALKKAGVKFNGEEDE